MFGELLQELEATIEFEDKVIILQKAREINKVRIQIVHKLTRQTSLDELKVQALKVKDLFYEILNINSKVLGRYYKYFEDFKKNINWEEIL